MSEIQSIEGRPTKKGLSPGRRSAYGALALLGGAIAVVVVGQLLQPPAVPLDHALALVRGDGAVELGLPDGTAATTLGGAGIPTDAQMISWAPGGNFLALRNRVEVVIVDRAGVVAWRHTLRSLASAFAWSPDGSRIAFLDGADAGAVELGPVTGQVSLEVDTVTGALEWQVPVDPALAVVAGYGALAWSPDGASIAFTGLTERVSSGVQWSSVWVADTGSQTVRRLTTDTTTFDYGPAWSARAGLLVGQMRTGASSISVLDRTTGTATELLRRASTLCGTAPACSPVHLSPLVPSPDGSLVAFRDPMFGLTVLNPSTREVVHVPQDEIVPDGPYAWSADGASLFLAGRPTGTADPLDPGSLARFDVTTRTLALILSDVRAFDFLPGAPTS